MNGIIVRRGHLLLVGLAVLAGLSFATEAAETGQPKGKPRHLLYVAAPGIRDYLEFGVAGILVFDMDNNYKFVKRIKTPASAAKKPENIKGICACAKTKKLYFSTLTKLYCMDLVTEKTL